VTCDYHHHLFFYSYFNIPQLEFHIRNMQLFLNETDHEISHLTFALTCGKELLHVKGRTALLPKIIKSKKTLSVIKKMFALKFSIFLLSFAALTEAQEPYYVYHECSNTTTFVRNSTYQANLNILLSSLAGNATRNDIKGFYNASTLGVIIFGSVWFLPLKNNQTGRQKKEK